MTIYSSLVYGILYLLFLAMPYTYISTRDWSAKKSSLPFLAVLIGIFLCCLATALTDITWRVRRFLARHRTILPEDRLPQLMVSTIILPQGLFWFAWTSKRSVPWTAQVCSGVLIGAVISLNLLSTTAYLIDVYMLHSKGAVAVYLCMRSFLGAMFPLFALQMFEDFGVEWAATVLALLCVGLSPMSFLFWRYGKTIRGWSRYVLETLGLDHVSILSHERRLGLWDQERRSVSEAGLTSAYEGTISTGGWVYLCATLCDA